MTAIPAAGHGQHARKAGGWDRTILVPYLRTKRCDRGDEVGEKAMRWLASAAVAGLPVFALLANSGVSAQEKPVSTPDKTIVYRSGDPEMAAAVEKAQQTLPEFWKMFAAPEGDVGKFSLKVAITDPGANITEHFWLGTLKTLDDGRIEGTVNNVPNHVTSVKHGQRYAFKTDQITDWMFYRRGKIVGGYTIRPLLKRLSKERADQIRGMLEDP